MEMSRPAHAAFATVLAVAFTPAARAAPPIAPLVATATAARADGLTLVPVEVSGGPPREDGEREDHPELPAVSCAGATTVPPTAGRPPAVVAPLRPAGGTLDCIVRLRDATARFTVRLDRPVSGAYASLDPAAPRAGDPSVQVQGLIVAPGGGLRTASRLRLASSLQAAHATTGPTARLELPRGGPPRAVALVLDVDGQPAAAFFPLTGRVELPVRTRNARSVTVRLPGVYAGPFEVHGERVAVPAEVPPGVGTAVVRARSARGEAREEVVDLNPPQLTRLAVLGPPEPLGAGATGQLWIAIADERGAPAGDASAPVARATGGTVATTIRRGPGLWEVPFRAPATPGPVEITVAAPGDGGAGTAVARLDVHAGPPRGMKIVLPRHALRPGERFRARLTVRDAAGNLLTGVPLHATLGDAPATIEPAGTGYVLSAVVPELLRGRSLRLRVAGPRGGLEADVRVTAGPGTTARLVVSSAGRRADLRVSVADRFGNPVADDRFAIRARGGRVGPLHPDGPGYRATLEADPTARVAAVEVLAGEQVLVHERARFAPPPGALRAGAWAGVGWLSNLGDVSAPRYGGGPSLRRGFGPLELTLAAGVEGLSWSGSVTQSIAGAERAVARELAVVSVPVTLRSRVQVHRLVGIGAALGVVPTWARGRVSADFQAPERFATWIFGVRGEAGGDLALGPGRVVATVGYGYAPLRGTPITGNLDGVYVRVGYEWWFWSPTGR